MLFEIVKPALENESTPLYEVIISSSVVSAVLSGVINHFIGRKKNKAETLKAETEVQKMQLEMKLLKRDLSDSKLEITAAASYNETSEVQADALYNGKGKKNIEFDFTCQEGHSFAMLRGREIKSEESGLGNVDFKAGMLNIHRQNLEGRFEIWLISYNIRGKQMDRIPQAQAAGPKTKIKISLMAKTIGGEHSLVFTFKGIAGGAVLSRTERQIYAEDWQELSLYFMFDVTEDCQLRIDDYNLVNINSTLKLKDLVLTEGMV